MKILIFGDSITQGFHDDVMGGWCNRLAQYAIKQTVTSGYEYDSSVFNLGISGDNTKDLTERFSCEIKARLTDCDDGAVLFAFGVNDSQYELVSNKNRVPLDKYKENLVNCIKEAKKYTENIFIVSLLPINESLLMPMPWKPTHGYKTEFVNQYNRKVQETAKEQKCTLIDLSNVFGDECKIYLPDGIHPNAEGHRLVFERVKEELKKATIF